MERKEKLITNEIYHVFNRSIAEFQIFNAADDFARMKNVLRYYQYEDSNPKFSKFISLMNVMKNGFNSCFSDVSQNREKLIQIIAYCIMPTHFHIVVKQLKDNGISTFMGDALNSYARYFNIKHNRKGPLWEGRFRNVRVENDEQLLHLTRYVHLNPVTAYLVDDPRDWHNSSYNEYLTKTGRAEDLCRWRDILSINIDEYKKFIKDRVAYQRALVKIKNHLLD